MKQSFFYSFYQNPNSKRPSIINTNPNSATDVFIIGSIKQSKIIQRLIQLKKLDLAENVLDSGGDGSSHLGLPETKFINSKND